MEAQPALSLPYERLEQMLRQGRYEQLVQATDSCPPSEDYALILRAKALLRLEGLQDRDSQAIDCVRPLLNTALHAHALLTAGAAKTEVRDTTTARQYLNAARMATDDPDVESDAGYTLARCDYIDGIYDPSLVVSYGAFETKDPSRIGKAFCLQAFMYHGLGDSKQFLAHLKRATDFFSSSTEIILATVTAQHLICTGMEVGDHDAVECGERLFSQLDWSSTATDRSLIENRYLALRGLAWYKALCGHDAEALILLRRSVTAAPSEPYRILSLADRALVASLRGDDDWAKDAIEEATSWAASIDWSATKTEEHLALMNLARVLAPINPERARVAICLFDQIQRAQSATQVSHSSRIIAMRDAAHGVVLKTLGEAQQAEQRFKSAYATFRSLGYSWRMADVLTQWDVRLSEAKTLIDGVYPSSWLARHLNNRASISVLSPAQLRVLKALHQHQDFGNKEMADSLQISVKTLSEHIGVIAQAFGSDTGRRGIIRWCSERHIDPLR